jgi:ABC-2 type transport system ATP-binding protein
MINVEKLNRRYGELTAVDNLSFVVRPGEVLGLVGPNGAGKTTTLRMLAGIVQPTSGQLSIAGHDLMQEPIDAKRITSYVPDHPNLFDALTVNEHLDFTAALYKVKDHRMKTDQLLNLFDLTAKRDTVADNLSLGMRQKLSICCAYLTDPSALIFDEPLTGLDPHGMRSIQHSIGERAAKGAAVIISSHILSLVETLCTHVLIMNHGRSLYYDSMENMKRTIGASMSNSSLESVFLEITRSDAEG